MAAVCFMVDTVRWGGPVTNDEILELAAKEDVLIPFVSIDPHRSDAVAEARRLIDEHDVRGFKFHPSLQGFFPDDRLAYPLYEVIAEHKLPAVFHTGQTAVGSGLPRRRRDPAQVLEPDAPRRGRRGLPGHAGDHGPPVGAVAGRGALDRRPQAERVDRPVRLVAEVLPAPARAPGQLVLREKVLFGTDFPALTPERWLRDFEALDIKPEVRPLILKENARRLLGL